MHVVCPECGGIHEANFIKTLNIEEDIEGRDVLEFICPVTEETTKSIIYGSQYNFGRKACRPIHFMCNNVHRSKCIVIICI